MPNDFIKALKEEFKGYHLEIQLYPSGGRIEATGCEECGTSESIYEGVSWRDSRGQSFDEAKEKLKQKLGISK